MDKGTELRHATHGNINRDNVITPTLITTTIVDKNHAPFKLNGQSCTAFRLLKAPELQRLSVTIEVLRVGVTIVVVISVGVMTLSRYQFTPFPKCYMSKKSKVESANFIIETNCDCGETDGIQNMILK
jgi:hypothetical protein